MRTITIPTMAPPTALTRRVASAIRPHWHKGDLEAVAAAAVEAVCAHLAQATDESLDPRVNLAVESFLAYEYRENDSCARLECPEEDAPGQRRLDFFTGQPVEAGHDGGIRRAEFTPDPIEIDADATCTWDVVHGPGGTVDFENVRPLNPSKALRLLPLVLLAVFLSASCGASTSARDRRDGHQVEATATRSTATVESAPSVRALTAAEAARFPPPPPRWSASIGEVIGYEAGAFAGGFIVGALLLDMFGRRAVRT